MRSSEEFDWSETHLRVRYAETDQGGVVYHSNFLIWFEVGRVELCRDHGFAYRDMEQQADAFLPVTAVRVRYRSPAIYDDEVTIRTRVTSIRSRAITFAYQALRKSDGTLLAEGETDHVVRNREGRARSFPIEYSGRLRQKIST